jgi:phosphoglycerol transferase MdoB-like AlkP superfamily enzyme
VAALWPRLRRRLAAAPPRWPGRRWAALLLAAGVVASALPVAVAVRRWDRVFVYDYFRFIGVRQIGLLNYHALDAGRQVARAVGREELTPAERGRVAGYLAARRDSAPPSPLFGVARGHNVIVVMVESLNAFLVDLTVDGRPVMPNLRAFARRSMSFDHVYDQTWAASTADAELASLQSLYPLEAGAVQTRYTENAFHGLPAVLAGRGYATMAAHAYAGELWKRREIYPKLGFERSHFLEAYAPGRRVGLGLGDVSFVRQTAPMLRRERSPYFAFLVTLSTHFAYDTPPDLRRLPAPGVEGTLLRRYLNAVHYADEALGVLFAELERSGALDSAVVVVFGDHRPRNIGAPRHLAALLERHAGYPPESPASASRYWAARNRIPLLVHLPGDTLAGRYAAAGGQLDIAPTVLSLLGVPAGEMVALGRDLTAADAGLAVMRDGAFVRGDTLCTRGANAAAALKCSTLDDRLVDAARMTRWAAAVREELAVSDLIIRGDYLRDP